MAGERAALAVLEDRGVLIDKVRSNYLEHKLATIERFRHGLETAFPFPTDWAAKAPDALMICRCEEVSAGEIRAIVDDGHWEINRVKAHCRVAMGRCQGRMCGSAAAEIVAQRSGRALNDIGRLRGQAPIKPLPFGLEAES
jgi:NAD(P)H-nitrite reductase large subunit